MIKDVYLYWRLLLARLWTALAILLTIKNILALEPTFKCWIDFNGTICFIFILLASLVYALWLLFWKKKGISVKLNKVTKLTASYGDLFEKDGVKVIPVNEYFDTHLGNGIVSPHTIHGVFLKKNQERLSEIEKQIRQQLQKSKPLATQPRKRSMIAGLPQMAYPLGTCARIEIDTNKYLLVALTRFNENEHAEINIAEYSVVIQRLYYNMEQLCDANPVYMPLLGSGQSGVNLTKMQLLNTIIRAGQNSEVSIMNGIHVVLYGKEMEKEINLNVIEHLYECWKGL